MNNITKSGDICHIEKCGGVPLYPAKHSMFKWGFEGRSDEHIKSREKKAIKFLKEHGFDLPEED